MKDIDFAFIIVFLLVAGSICELTHILVDVYNSSLNPITEQPGLNG